MRRGLQQLLRPWLPRAICAAVAAISCPASGLGETSVERPDLTTARPSAACRLQSLADAPRAPEMSAGGIYYSQPTADDALANYERTALGDWQMPNEVDRNDPWLRFVLLSHKRPVVIDVAVFVDGKPYADGREAWIDETLKPAQAEPPNVAAGPKDKTKESNEKSPDKSTEKSTKKKVIAPEVTDPAKVQAQARAAPGMRERLRDYVATAGAEVDRREIRWLISEWGFGPPVVVMDRSLSWQRASVAPLFACLDANRSGALEANEIAGATAAVQRVDADANDVVELQELERKANGPPVLPFAADHALVVALNDATDMESLSAELVRLYNFDAAQTDELATRPADATFRIKFGDKKSSQDAAAIYAESSTASAGDDAITFDLGAEYIEFSAADNGADAATNVAATQIAVGAAIDGSPLWRLADGDHDGRLTLRERQQLPALLSSLDRDGDGMVAADELPIPIRFAVTRGPQVHRLLATPSAARKTVAAPAATQLPDWFLAMDANGDRDLSRAEFLGTAEQFGQFDADSDGLLSVEEAEKMMPAE